MAKLKVTKTVWMSEDWVKAMVQKNVVSMGPIIYFVAPAAGKLVKPVQCKLTIEQV